MDIEKIKTDYQGKLKTTMGDKKLFAVALNFQDMKGVIVLKMGLIVAGSEFEALGISINNAWNGGQTLFSYIVREVSDENINSDNLRVVKELPLDKLKIPKE